MKAIDEYFKAGIMNADEGIQGPVAKKTADVVRRSAKAFEDAALARADKIAAVPETEDGRLDQLMGFEDQVSLKDLAMINMRGLNVVENVGAKLAYNTRRWFFLDKVNGTNVLNQ